MKQSIIKWFLIAILVISGSVLIGFQRTGDKDFEIVKNLDIFYSLFRELNIFYVDETNPQELVETGINAMLESLDPYTSFIPEADMDDFNFMTTGNYGGIGAIIRAGGKGFTMVADPYEGSPSARAGLRGGDLLLSVDGYSTKDKPLDDISERLKGVPGTEVVLEVLKPGQTKPQKIKILRESIHIKNVSYFGRLDEKTGYIRLSNFTLGAGEEVLEAFTQLKEKEGIEHLILDLRNNPGGLLLEAVRVCNVFIDQGQLIVSTKGKVKQWDQNYYTTTVAADNKIPIVVLVNRGSASASEIVAGAMQDLDRAVIIGERTFGKGLVQTTRKLKYNTQLKVTTAKYYIPSGRCIQALDYTHRNEDGSVGYIPDSLISEFRTLKGRKVFDGGGISPDIRDSLNNLSEIALNLYGRNVIFDFVTEYSSNRTDAPLRKGFQVNEEEYQAFKKYVLSSGFTYSSRTAVSLRRMIETAKAEKYYEIAEAEFLALESRLGVDVGKDLERFRDEITELLEEEIMGRYYFQAGRIEVSLPKDNQVRKAMEVIEDQGLYNQILSGKSIISHSSGV